MQDVFLKVGKMFATAFNVTEAVAQIVHDLRPESRRISGQAGVGIMNVASLPDGYRLVI